MTSRILIVEDDRDLVTTLEYGIRREGYETLAATTGRSGLTLAAGEPAPDLVLLDIMLPDMPGTEVCRTLRAAERTRHLPIIMVTAKGEEMDRVLGFEVGADDYVVKPFSVRELLLRVRAILRRTSITELAPVELSFGRLRVDPEGHRVWVDEREVRLTALEFRLLMVFAGRRGRVQTRERLLDDVWGIHSDVMTRTVDAHVKRLREKLGEAGRYIQTLHGVGYRFRDDPDEAD